MQNQDVPPRCAACRKSISGNDLQPNQTGEGPCDIFHNPHVTSLSWFWLSVNHPKAGVFRPAPGPFAYFLTQPGTERQFSRAARKGESGEVAKFVSLSG
jgi:hypothetical protein